MKCYKLVFNNEYFKKNAGSIILLIFIFFYLIFLIWYIIRGIKPLELETSHLLFEGKDLNINKDDIEIASPSLIIKENKLNKVKDEIGINNIENDKKENPNEGIKYIIFKSEINPPKKIKSKKVRLSSAERKRKGENLKLIDIIMKKRRKISLRRRNAIKNIRNFEFDAESIKSDKVVKRKTIKDYQKEFESKRVVKIRRKNLIESSNNTFLHSLKKDIIETNINIKGPIKNNIKDEGKTILDDYELNHLKYDTAIELDKRGFFKTYWSIIKRDQLILFIFVSSKDFNLIYIKYARLIFTISTLMVMNAFLFSDELIHEFFMNGVKYNFGKHTLQITLSIIITHVLEILLCFLTMTDRIFYEIKSFSKN